MSDSITVTVEEGDRQMILLALAYLALSRPGWDWTLGRLAESFSASAGGSKALASLKEFLALRQAIIDLGGADHPLDQEMITRLAEMQNGVVERAKAAVAEAEGPREQAAVGESDGRAMFEEFKRLNADRVGPKERGGAHD